MKTIVMGLMWVAGLLTGCAHAPLREPQVLESGATGVRLTGGGDFRVATPEGANAWLGFRALNDGNQPLGSLRFWTAGDRGLMRDLGGGPEGPWVPFSLLPGERFICTAGAPQGTMDRRLSVAAMWELPTDATRLAGCIRNANQVKFAEHSGVEFLAPGASFEVVFAAPFPNEHARLAWHCTQMFSRPSATDRERDVSNEIQVWLSLDNVSWARLPAPAGGMDWLSAMDISSLIRDARYFALRFTLVPSAAPAVDPNRERPVTPVLMQQLRLEREMEAWGAMDHWRHEGGQCHLGWAEQPGSSLLLTFVPGEPTPSESPAESPIEAQGY